MCVFMLVLTYIVKVKNIYFIFMNNFNIKRH